MYDICFDVERNKITKRYGELTSRNTDQKCLFNIVDPDFVKGGNLFIRIKRDNGEAFLLLDKVADSDNQYELIFPAALCNSYGVYSIMLGVYDEDGNRFRSTQRFTGLIMFSGFTDSEYAPEYPKSFLENYKDVASRENNEILITEINKALREDALDSEYYIDNIRTLQDKIESLYTSDSDVFSDLQDIIQGAKGDMTNAIETVKFGIVDEYGRILGLTRQEKFEVMVELDDLFGSDVTSLNMIPYWSSPLFGKISDKAKEEDNDILVEDINIAVGEEKLSKTARFVDNVSDVKDLLGSTIITVNNTMYSETQENLAYTEAVDRIEEVRQEFETAVHGNTGDTYPTLIDKSRGYVKNSDYMDSIISYVESQTNWSRFADKFLGSDTNHLRLPYFNTENISFNMEGMTQPRYCEEIGFDMSKGQYTSSLIFSNCTIMKKLIITGFDKRDTVEESKRGSIRNFFMNLINCEEIYTDGIQFLGYVTMSSSGMFLNCTKLKIIGGFDKANRRIDDENYGKIDFTGLTYTGDINDRNSPPMFLSCTQLKYVRFVSGSLTTDLDMSRCYTLSKESALSAINACGEVSTATLKLSLANPNIQDTDPDIASAIASATAKGWSVAYA